MFLPKGTQYKRFMAQLESVQDRVNEIALQIALLKHETVKRQKYVKFNERAMLTFPHHMCVCLYVLCVCVVCVFVCMCVFVCVSVCACVHVSPPRLFITSGMMWHDI